MYFKTLIRSLEFFFLILTYFQLSKILNPFSLSFRYSLFSWLSCHKDASHSLYNFFLTLLNLLIVKSYKKFMLSSFVYTKHRYFYNLGLFFISSLPLIHTSLILFTSFFLISIFIFMSFNSKCISEFWIKIWGYSIKGN